MSDQEVLDLVTSKINEQQPTNFRLNVYPAIRRDNDWYYIAVSPDNSEIRVSDYNAVLVGVEDALKIESHINVLLVPNLPD